MEEFEVPSDAKKVTQKKEEKNMKRCLCLLVAGLMALLCAGGALAVEENAVEINAREIVLSVNAKNLGCRFDGSDNYCLIRPDGTKITEEIYRSMYTVSNSSFYRVEVTSQDGVHDEGVIDDQGQVLVPPEYADVSVISDRWIYGVKLTPSTADEKDYTFTNYSTGDKTFYRIDTVDFYYRGTLAGSLARTDFDGYPMAYGDYICVQTRERVRQFYNSRFEKSPVTGDYSGEYTTSYSKGQTTYVHNGSGQTAFAAGCTLTPEEVSRAIVYEKGKFLDLQGSEPFPAAQNYDYVNQFRDGYAQVRMNSMSGLVDMTGREVIPLEYEDVGEYTEHPFRFGYISAVKDGKFGYLDQNGNVTCPFTYSKDIVRNYGVLASIKDLDGSIIVLSAAAGVLPEHYADVSMRTDCRTFVAENAEGNRCLMDMDGTVLIPYTDTYSIYANYDGTTACVNLGGRKWRIYTFTHEGGSAQSAPGTEPAGETPETGNEPEPAAAGTGHEEAGEAAEDTWTCSNGHAGNTGNFCPECGEQRPATEIICPTCGTHYPIAEAPNFCPEDGTKLK